nr:hypothetical protein Q903MT_gene2767 [Picea sitchensis]
MLVPSIIPLRQILTLSNYLRLSTDLKPPYPGIFDAYIFSKLLNTPNHSALPNYAQSTNLYL